MTPNSGARCLKGISVTKVRTVLIFFDFFLIFLIFSIEIRAARLGGFAQILYNHRSLALLSVSQFQNFFFTTTAS